jgi:hypothetical protein
VIHTGGVEERPPNLGEQVVTVPGDRHGWSSDENGSAILRNLRAWRG